VISPSGSVFLPRMNIELYQIEQLGVAHLGEQKFRSALQHILDELLFGFDQLVDPVFNGAAADELVHQYDETS